MAANELHGVSFTLATTPAANSSTAPTEIVVSGDELLSMYFGWSYGQLWWYCFTAVCLSFLVFEVAKLFACRYVSFLKR